MTDKQKNAIECVLRLVNKSMIPEDALVEELKKGE